MKVGLVCPYDLSKPGGVQSQVLGLAATLTSGGDQTLVIGPGLPDDAPGIDLGESVAIPGNRSRAPISLNPGVGSRIREAASGLDLLHVHEPFMPLVSLTALRAGPPVVATFHADPGALTRRLYRSLGGGLRRVLGDGVTRITAVSATAASALPPGIDVVVVPNGLDVSAMRADVERAPARVVFLGRDEPRKGLDVLLGAWEEIVTRVPEAELVVMGANRGTGGITWLGRVDHKTKVDNLNSSAVFVAPHLGGESFGIVLLEAMAAGAAVVASAIPGFLEVAGEAAAFCSPGDSDDLARAVVDLLTDTDSRRALASLGATRALEFDWERVAPTYRAVYEEALSDGS